MTGAIASVLKLAGSVSVYCNWIRKYVWPATSISVQQHGQLALETDPYVRYPSLLLGRQATNKQLLQAAVARPET